MATQTIYMSSSGVGTPVNLGTWYSNGSYYETASVTKNGGTLEIKIPINVLDAIGVSASTVESITLNYSITQERFGFSSAGSVQTGYINSSGGRQLTSASHTVGQGSSGQYGTYLPYSDTITPHFSGNTATLVLFITNPIRLQNCRYRLKNISFTITYTVPHTHSYTSVVTPPTCTAQGYTTHTCSGCGDSYKNTYVAAKGHTPGAAATCTTAQTCTTCGATITAAKGHTWIAATCTTPKTCSVCKITEGSALGHSYTTQKIDPIGDSFGYTRYTCSCGDWYDSDFTCRISVESSNTTYGTVSGGNIYNINSDVVLTATPSKGYHVAYWMKNGVKIDGTDNNASGAQTYRTTATSNDQFVAVFEPTIFSIRYNPNGTEGEPVIQDGMYEIWSEIYIDANPFTKTGYTFTSWNDNPDGSGRGYNQRATIFNVWPVEHDMIKELYAQWTPNSYTIIFEPNGGIGSMDDFSMVYDAPSNLPVNTLTKAGHIFNGWNTAQDGSGTSYDDGVSVNNLVPKGNITLWAQWKPIQYAITWKDWDGSELEKVLWDYGSIPSYSGDTESLSYETDEAFYDFDGWSPNVSWVSGNTTYTATYLKTIKTYTVTWLDWDGGELEVDTNVLYGDIPVFNYTKTPHKEPDDQYYYVFNNNWDIAIAPVTGNITYTAVYTKNIYYTVVWKDWNGDVLETDDKVMYDTPPSYDREDPTRESTELHEYKFLGWKTEISDEYADEDDLSVVRADITYIAVYEEIDRMYSFDINILPSSECGRVEGYTDTEYKYGSELTLTAYPNDGYQFVSWSYTIDGVTQTVMSDRLEISIFEDTEVTALFEERSSLPAIINETQVESAYVNPESLTITYVISGDLIESTIQNDIVTSVDGWSFVISNEIPEDGYKVDNIYIDDIRIY